MRIDQGIGVVSDRWFNAIQAGTAFSHASNSFAHATNLSFVQFLNPSTSGVFVYIKEVIIDMTLPSTVSIKRHDTPIGGIQLPGFNLWFDQPDSKSTMETSNAASLPGTTIVTARALTDPNLKLISDWAYRLEPGHGIIFGGGVSNSEFRAFIQWMEVPV